MKSRCDDNNDMISSSMSVSSASNVRAGSRGAGGDDDNGEAIKILDSMTDDKSGNENENEDDAQMRIMGGCHPCNVGCSGSSSLSLSGSSSLANAAAGCVNGNMVDKDSNKKEGED